jgi:SAM-dependent methyltransferase
MSTPTLTREQLLEMASAFRPSCVLGAAAELDLFAALGREALSAEQLAERLRGDLRATRMLADACAALGLLQKQPGGSYSVPPDLRPLLADGPKSILPMVLHSMNILRSWARLAWVVRSGKPPEREPSVRGADADRAAFIAAMHSISGPLADELVVRLGPPSFKHLLDVGGASGTWTLAFLRAVPGSRATLFDLPDAIAQARQRLAGGELASRVTLQAGDFYSDPLPPGADYAWVSAIIHQHSREHSGELFRKIHQALLPGGRIAIRDVVMQADHTRPVFGALFAINMLVNTESGGTFTFAEIADDLKQAGFVAPRMAIQADDMTSVVEATKPA